VEKPFILIAVAVLAGCAGGPPHHRGGFAGAGMAMANYRTAPHMQHAPGTADADAVLIASFDRDGDLLVSAAELDAGVAREFARADANHDHLIDPGEYQAWSLVALGGVYAPFRRDIDANGDGHISFDEFAAEFRARGHRYDANGDGVIEHADLVHGPANADDDVELLTPQSTGVAPDAGEDGPRRRR
jgi:EF hand domain-containing protein